VLEEERREAGVELAPGSAADLGQGRLGRQSLPVGPVVGHRVRRPHKNVETELRRGLRRLVDSRRDDGRTAIVLVDDIDLVSSPGDALLQLRASALELYAADVSFAFVVAASPNLFGSVRWAHEPLVRFFESVTLEPLDAHASARAITEPIRDTQVRFDPEVVTEIVELSGGRPYYLQKLAYYAFDAAEQGRVTRAEFAQAFERGFASVSQEIFALRWAAMAPIERQIVAVVASATEPRPSGDIESEAMPRGIRPAATRQALRRLAARGHVDRLANGQRGRYVVRDRLFRRYLELQGCGP
jgi:hypothetical protein